MFGLDIRQMKCIMNNMFSRFGEKNCGQNTKCKETKYLLD